MFLDSLSKLNDDTDSGCRANWKMPTHYILESAVLKDALTRHTFRSSHINR